MPSETAHRRTAYVVKVYPRFSETFVVTEILAREAAGEDLAIYALRPTSDPRFHPQLAQVRAPVTHLPRPHRLAGEWAVYARAQAELPDFGPRFGALMPLLARLEPSVIAQGVELALRLRTDGITDVHVHFATAASWATAIASALTDIPFTVTTHAKDLFHQDVDHQVLREVLGRASRVVAISAYNADFLLTRVDPGLAEKVVLVRNGLSLDRFDYRDPDLPASPLRVLAVGRLVEKKGFAHLVEAASIARNSGLALQVRIVGEGDQRTDLAARIDQCGLADTVRLLGPCSQAELVEELHAADVLVAPCIVGGDGNADGLPTVLLEAMASGVPCIATDVTGIGEAVHPADDRRAATGVLLDAEPDGLSARVAEALTMVAAPGWPRREVARAARRLVETNHDTARQSRLLASLLSPVDAQRAAAGVR